MDEWRNTARQQSYEYDERMRQMKDEDNRKKLQEDFNRKLMNWEVGLSVQCVAIVILLFIKFSKEGVPRTWFRPPFFYCFKY